MNSTGKFDRLNNFIASFFVAFGLLASFGGIDLATLAAIFLVLSPILVLRTHKSEQGKNLFIWIIFASLLLLIVAFYIGHSLYLKNPYSEGMKHIIWIPLLLPFAIILIRKSDNRDLIARGIIAGFAFLLIILSIEAVTNYRMYKIANPMQSIKDLEVNLGRAAFICLCLFWPTMLAARIIKIETKVIFIAFILNLYIGTKFGMDLHFVLFPIAAIAALLARFLPRFTIGLVFLVPSLLVAFAPLLYNSVAVYAKNTLGDSLPMSWGRRADMWIYAYNRILEKRIFGWGFDGARQFNEKVQYAGYEWGAIQMHPHSGPLHIWLEGGVVGALLFIAFILTGAVLTIRSRLINKQNAWAFCGLLTSIIIAWCLSYSIWEQWLWAVSFFLIGGMAILVRPKEFKKIQSK